MGTLKETFNQYKWVLLAGIIVAILIALITANLHVLQFMGYKMKNDTEGIISILETYTKNEDKQDDVFFVQGITYLVEQDTYTDEIRSFFESNFSYFSAERQKQIVKGYNSKKLTLTMSENLMRLLVENIDDDVMKAYIQRITPSDLEQGLAFIYGTNPSVNESLVNSLYELLNVYPDKLEFNKFQFNLYDILIYSGENAEVKKKAILSKIPSELARENIFKELRTKSITEEQIYEWVEFFNDTEIISKSEYTAFKDAYSEIHLIRSQYKALDEQQVELQNKKDAVDVQISNSLKQLEEKQNDISEKQKEISALETQIDELTNYTHMALYIEKAAGTGSNEYIASIPRNSLFGFKPSSQKYIVKLQESSLSNEGVQYLDIYYKGSKTNGSGEEYAYYVEVSKSDLANISALENERSTKLSALEKLKEEAATLESEIASIKKENQYDENQQALMNIATQREELSSKLSEKTISIKELFGLKDLKISLEA